jgi:hypothetical protein
VGDVKDTALAAELLGQHEPLRRALTAAGSRAWETTMDPANRVRVPVLRRRWWVARVSRRPMSEERMAQLKVLSGLFDELLEEQNDADEIRQRRRGLGR